MGCNMKKLLSYLILVPLIGCTSNKENNDSGSSGAVNNTITSLSITSISPSTTFLEGSKTVTISGTGFEAGISVTIDGVACTSVNVSSGSSLTCINPMHAAGAVDVVLTRSSDSTTATLTGGLTYSSTAFSSVDYVSGAPVTFGSSNGAGTSAKFYQPTDIVENNGVLYVSDTKNNLIRQINISTGVVSDLAGVRGSAGHADGLGNVATFSGPTGLAISAGYLYVAETTNCDIRRIDLSTTQVTTWAGTAGHCLGDGINTLVPATNGTQGSAIGFSAPWGLQTDGTYLYVNDSASATIQQINMSTVTTQVIIGSGSCATADGSGTSAGLCAPIGLALSGTNLFIGDPYYYKVRKADLSANPPAVTTFAGTNNSTGSTDAVGTSAKFGRIGDMVSDGTYIYLADSSNDTIRRIEIATQNVTTIVGTAGAGGYLNATGNTAKLSRPSGLALSGGNLYISDAGNNAIRVYNISTGSVTTLAGYGGN